MYYIIVDHIIDKATNIYSKVKKQIESSAAKYRMDIDKLRRVKSFNEGIRIKSKGKYLHMIDEVTKTYSKAKKQLESSAAKYKMAVDKHRRVKSFNEGDIVMVHLRKERFLNGEYSKLVQKLMGLFYVPRKISDNAYVINLFRFPFLRLSISKIYTSISFF